MLHVTENYLFKKNLKFHETKTFFKCYVDFLHIPAWGGGRNLLLKYFLTSVTVTLPLLLESSFLKAYKIIPRTINNISILKYTWSISRLEKVEDWNWRVKSETLQWKNNSLIFYSAMVDLVNSFTNKSVLCHGHAWHTFLTFDLRHSFICPKTSLI